jgi:hypothetical protein
MERIHYAGGAEVEKANGAAVSVGPGAGVMVAAFVVVGRIG